MLFQDGIHNGIILIQALPIHCKLILIYYRSHKNGNYSRLPAVFSRNEKRMTSRIFLNFFFFFFLCKLMWKMFLFHDHWWNHFILQTLLRRHNSVFLKAKQLWRLQKWKTSNRAKNKREQNRLAHPKMACMGVKYKDTDNNNFYLNKYTPIKLPILSNIWNTIALPQTQCI